MTTDQQLTPERLRQLAEIARLELSDEELTEFAQQMEPTLDLINKLDDLDLDNIEPALAIGAYPNRFRDDTPREPLPRIEALQNAPRSRDGSFETVRLISKIDR